ncbi:MAG: hypothetical protein Q9165_005468 [Trypethelium subeluteriae]
MAQDYKQQVKDQSAQNPHLKPLDEFLSDSSTNLSCRIKVLDFSRTGSLNSQEEFDEDKDRIDSKLQGTHLTTRNNICERRERCTFLGRVMIIKGPTPSVIEQVGSVLHVDPIFFASHISSPSESLKRIPALDNAVSLARTASLDFTNIHYHQLLSFPERPPSKEMQRDAPVKRKILELLKQESTYVSLADQYIVLVDQPIKERENYLYDADGHGEMVARELSSQPLLRPRDSLARADARAEHNRLDLLDALARSWDPRISQIDRENPTLWSLACSPLQIVVNGWTEYIDVMRSSIEQYNYSSPDLLSAEHERERLQSDLDRLRFWGCRFASAKQRIEITLDFLHSNNASDSSPERPLSHLLEDYGRKLAVVEKQIKQVDDMIGIIVSLIKSDDRRQAEASYAGSANSITRLTSLVLVFISHALISGVFGASLANGLGAMHFPVRLVVELFLTYLWLQSAFTGSLGIRAHFHTLYEYGTELGALLFPV